MAVKTCMPSTFSGFRITTGVSKTGLKFLSHKAMANRRLLSTRDFVDLLGQVGGESSGFRHVVCLLKGLDGSDGRIAQLARKLLRREIAQS